MKNKYSTNVLILCVVNLVASFMPWGTFQASINLPFGDFNFGEFPFGGTQTITINAWNSNLTLLGLTIPNWTLVFIAIGIGGLLFTKVTPKVNMLLAAYGVFHSLFLGFMLIANGTVGIGLIITVVSFIAIMIFLILSNTVKEKL